MNAGILFALVLIHPISRYMFYTDLIKQLYYAKTDNDELLMSPNDKYHKNSKKTKRRLKYILNKNMDTHVHNNRQF